MAEGSDGNARRKGVILTKSVVYGNIAKYFGKKRDEDGHTHAWTCYLRPFKNEDMSVYIRKVQFKLHESYANPIRVLTRPPYEVSETGWGEFEIVIKVFFVDSSEKPLTIYHLLKLFQNDPAIISGKKNVVSEHYDEIVFTDPTSTMYRVLTSPKSMVPAVRHEPGIDCPCKRRSLGTTPEDLDYLPVVKDDTQCYTTTKQQVFYCAGDCQNDEDCCKPTSFKYKSMQVDCGKNWFEQADVPIVKSCDCVASVDDEDDDDDEDEDDEEDDEDDDEDDDGSTDDI